MASAERWKLERQITWMSEVPRAVFLSVASTGPCFSDNGNQNQSTVWQEELGLGNKVKT